MINGLVILSDLKDVEARIEKEGKLYQLIFVWREEGDMERIVLNHLVSSLHSPQRVEDSYIFADYTNARNGR